MRWSRAALGGVAVGILAVAVITSVRPLYVLGYGLLLLLVTAALWSRGLQSRIRFTRRLEMTSPQVGNSYVERGAITRPPWLPALMVWIVDQGAGAATRVLGLGSRRARQWRSSGRFERRGWHSFGPTTITVSDPFGLFPRRIDFPASERVLVLPRIVDIGPTGDAGDHYPGAGSGQGAFREYPPESVGVREHQPGEALNRVHWPTTLHAGRLMVRQFDQPFASDIWVVLDLEASVHAGTGPESTLEYAVVAAASLASAHIARGRRVGLVASDGAGTLIEPRGGYSHLLEILHRLALVEADGNRRLAEVLGWRRWRRAGAGLAVVTPSGASDWLSVLVDRGRRGIHPTVFHIDAASFDPGRVRLDLPSGLSLTLRSIARGDRIGALPAGTGVSLAG